MTPKIRLNRFIAEVIRRECYSRGWSADELSNRAGLPPGFLSKIEQGSIEPSLLDLVRIQAALGIDLSVLWPVGKLKSAPVTDPLLFRLLDKAEIAFRRRVILEDIIYATGEACCIWPDDLASHSRTPNLGRAKAVAAALTRRTEGVAVSQLARLLRRDPSILHHSIRWYERTQPSNFQILIRRAEEAFQQLCDEPIKLDRPGKRASSSPILGDPKPSPKDPPRAS